MVPTGWFPRHRDGVQPLLSVLIYTRNKVKNQGIAQAISAVPQVWRQKDIAAPRQTLKTLLAQEPGPPLSP